MTVTLHLGNSLDALRGMADNSVDSIVTDPPYGLSQHTPDQVLECLKAWLAGEVYAPKGKGFMGKSWDAWVPGPEIWREALRVLKPGGHVLAFAGTRSMDLMSMAIRLAGFELRDSIGYAHDGGGAPLMAWTFGSGFPKSHDVSKAIDKAAGAERALMPNPLASKQTSSIGTNSYGDYNATRHIAPNAVTEAAQKWQGFGSALKPAWEPIILARKPLIGTLAENVLEHGTGALNIDGCRVHSSDSEGYAYTVQRMMPGVGQNATGKTHQEGVEFQGQTKDGRWPANLIHDGSDEVLAVFPFQQSGAKNPHINKSKIKDNSTSIGQGMEGKLRDYTAPASSGSAARFFYTAKASKKDRDEGLEGFEAMYAARDNGFSDKLSDSKNPRANIHPTVKPTELMRYLCRLVTPPGGVVLDPFMGSGSTGKAAMLEGFRFVGCELSPEYMEIARARIEAARTRTDKTGGPKPVQKLKPKPVAQGQNDLFEAVA